MMKMQMDSAHMVSPTNMDCSHRPSSGPSSIASSCTSRSVTALDMSMEASETITPAALFTTLCATSNTPMTIFQVLDTISTAQAVLNIHLKNIQVSISCILFRSVTI